MHGTKKGELVDIFSSFSSYVQKRKISKVGAFCFDLHGHVTWTDDNARDSLETYHISVIYGT